MDASSRSMMIRSELDRYAELASAGDFARAWHSLERAHIIAQPMLGPHKHVHFIMLRFAIQTRDVREVVGQVARLVAAPLGTITGRLPVGNTGRSDVSMFKAMPIPADLTDIVGR